MRNINLSNTVGASTSVKSETSSTNASSMWIDFMNQFQLELENNGDISSKTESVDEDLMLYNFVYTLYQKFNIQENIGDLKNLESIKDILSSNVNIRLETNNNSNEMLLTNDNFKSELGDIKEFINYIINNNIDGNENISNKAELNNQFNLLIEKLKERFDAYDRLNNVSNSKNLDGIGAFNMSKIDEYNKSKNQDKDIDYLEDILSSRDKNCSNVIGGFNKFNTVYNTNVNTTIEQPINEIRQEFISEDIIKAVKYIKSNDMESLNVKFNPKDLGEIDINILKNNEESNLLITVDNDDVFDMVNDNIQDIKNHLKEINIDVKDVVISVKSNDENIFSDNFNRGFNQEGNFKQSKNNKYTKDNEDFIDDVTINEFSNDDNLNILI